MEFENKVILITGASRGIGQDLALTFGRMGARVVVNYFKSTREANTVVKMIEKSKGEAIKIKADVSRRNAVKKMIAQIIKKYDRIDVLINNAGAVFNPADWHNISENNLNKTIGLNLMGTFTCIREIAPIMLKQHSGIIVNIASLCGMLGASEIIAYAAAKAGVINLTKSFAKELAPRVRVNCLVLGRINYGMSKVIDKTLVKKYSQETLVDRMGKVEDVVNSIKFLVSKQSSFITGQSLIIDGGASLKLGI